MRQPCKKRTVICSIYKDGLLVTAQNTCDIEGAICPREDGDPWTMCKCVHAEIEALKKAGSADLTGGIAVIIGHYWVCEPCGKALRDAGIDKIELYNGALPGLQGETILRQQEM